MRTKYRGSRRLKELTTLWSKRLIVPTVLMIIVFIAMLLFGYFKPNEAHCPNGDNAEFPKFSNILTPATVFENETFEIRPSKNKPTLIFENDMTDYTIICEEYTNKSEGADIHIQYPQLVEYQDTNTQNMANEILYERSFQNVQGLIPELCVNTMDNSIYYYQNYVVASNKRSYTSFIFEGEWCRGVRSPNGIKFGVTLDLNTGEIIELFDIVDGNMLRDLLLNGQFHQVNPSYEGEESYIREEWIKEEIQYWRKNISYYLTDKSIVIILEKYRSLWDHVSLEITYEEAFRALKSEAEIWGSYFSVD